MRHSLFSEPVFRLGRTPVYRPNPKPSNQPESAVNPARIRASPLPLFLLPPSLPESDLALFYCESLAKTRLRFQIIRFGVGKNHVPTRHKKLLVENKDESAKPPSGDKAVHPRFSHRSRSQSGGNWLRSPVCRVKSISQSVSDSPSANRLLRLTAEPKVPACRGMLIGDC